MNDQIRPAATATTTTTATATADAETAATATPGSPARDSKDSQRAYEQSGCYPAEGKSFRLWALLGGLSLVIIFLAVAAAVLNIYFLGAPWKAG